MKDLRKPMLILFILTIALTSCEMRRSETWEVMSDKESDNGNIEKALKHINNAIKITPTKSILFYKKALYLTDLKLHNDAMNSIDNAIKLCNTDYNYYSTKANILVEINQIDSAFINYALAIKLGSSKPSIYVDRGIVFEKINEPDKALADYNKAISLDSTYYNAFYYRGLLNSTIKKDYKSAIEDFSKMIKNYTAKTLSDKKFLAAAYLLRGACFDLSGDLDMACNDFGKAKELGLKEADKYIKDKCIK